MLHNRFIRSEATVPCTKNTTLFTSGAKYNVFPKGETQTHNHRDFIDRASTVTRCINVNIAKSIQNIHSNTIELLMNKKLMRINRSTCSIRKVSTIM